MVSSTSSSERCATRVIRPSSVSTTPLVDAVTGSRPRDDLSGSQSLEAARGLSKDLDLLREVSFIGKPAAPDLGRRLRELFVVRLLDAVDEVVVDDVDETERGRADRDAEHQRGDEREAPADRHRAALEPVARAAHGLQRLQAEGRVDLLAEVAHVHLDDVGVAGEVDPPHVVEDLRLRRDAAVLAHQVLEQRELACSEPDVDVLAPCPSSSRVELERADGEHRGARWRAATDQRPQPREEHHERERLREEVVGAGVERLGLVVLAVLRGEDEDRGPDPLVAQGPAHPVAVDPGEQHVEHDRVVGALAAPPEAVVAVVRDVDVEPLRRQTVRDGGREQLLVLDHQHAHA